jgi:hypothetical protein
MTIKPLRSKECLRIDVRKGFFLRYGIVIEK